MSDPNSQTRQRVQDLRFMADQARYHALRMSNNANLRGYADELEHEAARLEDLLRPDGRAVSRERTKPGRF